MKFIQIITTIFLFINSTISFSQQSTSPKKVGLCLSGGGAKGLAHIGLLKRIDSLNIKIKTLNINILEIINKLLSNRYQKHFFFWHSN